jgi:hypothetical protein
MTPDTVLRRRSNVEHIDVEGDVLLYDDLHLRLLPGVATEIWQRVDGFSSAGRIAAELSAAHGPRSDDITADVLAYLTDLLDHRVLELAPEAAGFVRPAHIGWVRDDDAVLLVDLADGRRAALTVTGSRIWELVAEGGSAEQVVTVLRAEFPDAPDTLAVDVATLLSELTAGGWLVRHPGAAPSER